jgi:aminoglycoside phosphotransferase (APT) family kinase protein
MSTPVERLAPAAWEGLRHLTTPAWLAAAAAPERICAAVRRQVPEFASGTLTLRNCEIKRLRLRDTGHWIGLYRFTVDGRPSGRPEVVAVGGTLIPPGLPAPDWVDTGAAFGSDRWRCYVPELRLVLETQAPETKLAALPQLTDAQAARALLEETLRAGAPAYHDLRLQTCTPNVVRDKPGRRCTIVYDLEYPPDLAAGRAWPRLVVAKTYDGDQGWKAYLAMRALWESPLARSRTVAIAEPLAFLPEPNVLVQGPVREEWTLKGFFRLALEAGTPEALEQLRGYLRKTGRGLAELHRCEVRCGEPLTWEDELAEIRARNAELAVPLPQCAEAITTLLARLERVAARYPADPAVPAHRSFRPAQVLLYKGEIGFIDFDGFCQGEPALDLALFLTEVREIGLGKVRGEEAPDRDARLPRLARSEDLYRVFLDEYTRVTAVSPPRIALWAALDLITLLQQSWAKGKLARVTDTLFLLERHLIDLDTHYGTRPQRDAGARPGPDVPLPARRPNGFARDSSPVLPPRAYGDE